MSGLTDRVDRASGLAKAITALVALLPSAFILLGVVPIPAAVEALTRYVSSAVTIVIVIAILLLGKSIGKIPKVLAAVLILVSVAIGAASAAAYLSFTRSHVVEAPDRSTQPLLIPLSPSPELRDLIEPYAEDYAEALATSIQRDRIAQLMKKEDFSTVLAMLGLLVLAQVMTVVAIVVGLWRLIGADA